MGINNTFIEGSNVITSIGTQVLPNIPVTTPMFANSSWAAGDYIYQSATGTNAAPTAVTQVGGPITTIQATNLVVSGGLFSAAQTIQNITSTAAVYTGVTSVPDNQYFTTVAASTTTDQFSNCVALTNGNIVVTYVSPTASPTGYYFKIYNSQGGVVLADTHIATPTGTELLIPVATSDGGFCIGYRTTTPSGRFINNKYTASGTLVSSIANTSALAPRVGASYTARAIELTNGRVVYGYFMTTNGITVTSFNSTNTSTNNTNTGGTNTNIGSSFALYPLPSTATAINSANGFGWMWWSTSSNQNFYAAANSSGSLTVGATVTTNPGYDSQDMILLADGTYVAIFGDSGTTLQSSKMTINASGSPSRTGSLLSVYAPYAQFQPVKLIPMSGSGFAVLFFLNGGTDIYYSRSNTTTSANTLGGVNGPIATSANNSFGAAGGTNGFIYATSSSTTINFTSFATATITNGQTYTATSLLPPNFTFVGIAQTAATAGQTGNVIVSGPAIANNNMPNIAGTYYFDVTQNSVFGNKGYITGRNITLQGLE